MTRVKRNRRRHGKGKKEGVLLIIFRNSSVSSVFSVVEFFPQIIPAVFPLWAINFFDSSQSFDNPPRLVFGKSVSSESMVMRFINGNYFDKEKFVSSKRVAIAGLFLSLIILSSCQTIRNEDVVGVYEKQYKDTYHKLVLSSDLKFYFYIEEGMYLDSARGYWKLEGNKIALIKFPDSSRFDLIKCQSNQLSTINCFDSRSGKKIQAFANGFINNQQVFEVMTDTNGFYAYPEKLDSIVISELVYLPLRLKLHPGTHCLNVFLSHKVNELIYTDDYHFKNGKIIHSGGLELDKIEGR